LSLTDIFTVRKILQASTVFIPNVYNECVVLPLFDKAQLSSANIVEGSETVKIIRTATPFPDPSNPIALHNTDPVSFYHQRIVPDTVVVADSPLLTNVFVESLDYIIDYTSGNICRSSVGSSIASGDSVYVWYLPFVVLSLGDDYNIDYVLGQINRRGGSTIPNGATLYVDYLQSSNLPSESLIEELIFEMEAYIGPRLRSEYSLDSIDPELKSAATNYVLYSYCLAAATHHLSFVASDISDDISKSFISLSEKYLSLARVLFSRFLSVGLDTIGGVIQNRFPTSRSKNRVSPSVPVGFRSH